MKVKMLIIIIISFLLCILIYNNFSTDKLYILSLGDDLSLGKTFNKNFNYSFEYYLKQNLKKDKLLKEYNNFFTEEKITYKILNDKIETDYMINIKKDEFNIKKAVAKSDIIIISVNNEQFFEKCNKKTTEQKEYIKSNYSYLNKIINQIKMIKNAKIIILGNYCYEYKDEINNYIEKIYIFPKNVYYINLYKRLDREYIINSKLPYPSAEGHKIIYNLISEYIN